MSYEFYKLLHVLSIIIYFGSLGALMLGQSKGKSQKIALGVSSFIVLVAGMGLLAKMGRNDGGAWPLWVSIKIGLWAVLAIAAPIFNKRLKASSLSKIFWVFISIGGCAAYLAINKPH